MATKAISYPKKSAEEILKDALPNEFLISVIHKDFVGAKTKVKVK